MLTIPADLFAQQPPPAGVLDQVALDYQLASQMWLGRVLNATTSLFFWLAMLEFTVAGIMYMIASPQAREEKAGRFLVKIMMISFIYMLITQSEFWLARLVNSFAAVGEYAVGRIMSPSEIVNYGATLSGAVLRSVDVVGMLTNPPIVIYMTFTAFVIMLCYILIATQVVLTLVQSYILLSTGIFFLAFGAFRATASLAENFLLSCVHVGIKLMLLYFVVGLGEPLTRRWAELLRDDRFLTLDVSPILQVLAGVMILAFIVWYVPNKIASQITSGASLGLASAVRSTS
ncbi:MAG: type IV secretion system protein [Longimicrobiales bacterium]